jgi:hypothetical protein
VPVVHHGRFTLQRALRSPGFLQSDLSARVSENEGGLCPLHRQSNLSAQVSDNEDRHCRKE